MNDIDMSSLADDIAVHIPAWITVKSPNNLVGILERPHDKAGIYLRLVHPYSTNRRIEVSGFYPDTAKPDGPRHTITVSAKRTARDIASEIDRRFLPTYDRLYAECLATAEAARRRAEEKAEAIQYIAALLGIPYKLPRSPHEIRELDWSEDKFYARVRVEGEHVYLSRVSMSLAQFERMVAAIRAT